ncbi:MotA/TolQ/ExbB proton channel [Rhodothermus marinus SG0.5JP17-172]|uniref:motility protein A n=1 Tax=Rhodothermus marinus TaxID=29549 RepID=UPI000223D909|nr:MotA/TolQ/ExbB proton channel family protein [Rhodothermus marinus]AEN74013.1 MotA/TolQ/ExbB proton channel [Rhodothermus marinus SG0.5JP17-172]
MEKATPIGLVLGFALILGSIVLGGDWLIFINIPSILIVVGGTIAALLVAYSIEEVKLIIPGTQNLLRFNPPDLSSYVALFTDLSRTARREGLLALDRRLSEIEDEFIRFGLEMAVDGIEEQEIAEMLQVRMIEELRPQQTFAKLMNSAGTFAPSFGMIGTLIGLIQMMQNLSDPTQVGAGMAVAMLTTLYGSILANLVFLPMANKTKMQLAQLTKAREMARTGILSIVRGDSPSMIERRLQILVKGAASGASAQQEQPHLAKAA